MTSKKKLQPNALPESRLPQIDHAPVTERYAGGPGTAQEHPALSAYGMESTART